MGKKHIKVISNTLPELTGPYPSVIKTKPVSKGNSNITDEVKRLGDFIHLTSKTVDVRNRYTEVELNEHTSFIEDNMQALVGNISKLDSLFASKQLLRRGSSYSGTKVLFPNEYDYMPILANFNRSTVEVNKVKDTCDIMFRDKGYPYTNLLAVTAGCDSALTASRDRRYGYMKVRSRALSMQNVIEYTECRGRYLSCKKLYNKLRELVIQSLQHMDRFNYIGVKYHNEKLSAPYNIGDISIHMEMHGPSIWLRVGAPLCTTDVDLCFSMEVAHTKQLGPCLMLRGYTGDSKCDCGHTYSEHWVKSVLNPPVNTKYVLSESHQKLFITLKFISHLAAEMSGRTYSYRPSILSSYVVNTLLLHHQQTCQAINVGECRRDVVWRILDEPDDMNKIYIHYNTGPIIPDVFFPQRLLDLKRSHSIAAIAWFMLQLSHTEDDSWIHKVLSLTQEPHTHMWWDTQLAQSGSDCEQLRDLMKVIRKVDNWYIKSDGWESPLTLEWHHIDGSLKASLTLEYEEQLL